LRIRAGSVRNFSETDKRGFSDVEFYAALILALTLAAVAAVLYFYVMFLEARSRQQTKHIAELERANAELKKELRQTKPTLEREPPSDSQDLWPDTLDESSDLSRNR
jgi:type II secretory pathway component PulJ